MYPPLAGRQPREVPSSLSAYVGRSLASATGRHRRPRELSPESTELPHGTHRVLQRVPDEPPPARFPPRNAAHIRSLRAKSALPHLAPAPAPSDRRSCSH